MSEVNFVDFYPNLYSVIPYFFKVSIYFFKVAIFILIDEFIYFTCLQFLFEPSVFTY